MQSPDEIDGNIEWTEGSETSESTSETEGAQTEPGGDLSTRRAWMKNAAAGLMVAGLPFQAQAGQRDEPVFAAARIESESDRLFRSVSSSGESYEIVAKRYIDAGNDEKDFDKSIKAYYVALKCYAEYGDAEGVSEVLAILRNNEEYVRRTEPQVRQGVVRKHLDILRKASKDKNTPHTVYAETVTSLTPKTRPEEYTREDGALLGLASESLKDMDMRDPIRRQGISRVQHERAFRRVAGQNESFIQMHNERDPVQMSAALRARLATMLISKKEWMKIGILLIGVKNHKALRDVAEKEEKGVSSPEQSLALAKEWEKFAASYKSQPMSSVYIHHLAMQRAATHYADCLSKTKSTTDAALATTKLKALRNNGFEAEESDDKRSLQERLDAGEWVDVTGEIDPEKNAMRGSWSKSRNTLSKSNLNGPGQIAVPRSLSGDYEFKATFNRGDNSGHFNVVFPVGDKSLQVLVFDDMSGFEFIDGVKATKSPFSKKHERVSTNNNHEITISVANQRNISNVTVRLNGNVILKWSGANNNISAHKNWRVDNGEIGIGSLSGSLNLSRIQIRLDKNGKALVAKE